MNTNGAVIAAVAVMAAPADASEVATAAQADGAVQAPGSPANPQAPAIPQTAPMSAKDIATAQAGAAQATSIGGKKDKEGAAQQIPQPAVDAVSTDEQKPTAKQTIETGIRASVDVAVAAASKPVTNTVNAVKQGEKAPAMQAQNSASSNVAPDTSVKVDTKPDAALAGNRETLESALSKHFSADTHITDSVQIVLPDASRLSGNTAPLSVSLQTSASAATNQPVPLQNAALAIEIASRAKDGSRQFDIRLDPPELGRIDVKLDVDKSGQVNTHLTVDRPETLDLLRRDSQGLERALQQAGLKTSDGGLEFSLRQQTPDGTFQGRNQAQANVQGGASSGADVEQTATINAEQYQWAARMRGGVDIRV